MTKHRYEFGANPQDDMLLLAHAEQTYMLTPHAELAGVPSPVEVCGPASRALVWNARADFAGGAVVVALRGTQTEADWATDLDMQLVPRDNVGDGLTHRLGAMLSPRGRQVRVHAGFSQSIANLKTAGLVKAIQTALQQAPHPRRVLLTGHSLGGALALLLGLDVALSSLGCTVDVLAWGAPQVGDEAFAALCKRTSRLRAIRVENTTDLICRMPGLLAPFNAELGAYRHACDAVRLDDSDLVDQALQYAQRAIRAVASAMGGTQDGWRLLGRISSHSIGAYRDNLHSIGVPAFERTMRRAAAFAAFVALVGTALAEVERELGEEARRRHAAEPNAYKAAALPQPPARRLPASTHQVAMLK